MSIVLKLGGTSISKHGFDIIIKKVNEYKNNDNKIIIVLSALTGTTNYLLDYLKTLNESYIEKIKENHIKLLKELNLDIKCVQPIFKNIDNLVKSINLNKDNYLQNNELITYGEYLSTTIFCEYTNKFNLNYTLCDSSKFIKSKNNSDTLLNSYFMKGQFYCNDYINSYQDKILICQGFVASSNDNYKCTLSRGGSDTSASLIAYKLNSDRLEIWTDVNGIYNANPSLIPDAKIINHIDYNLSQELAAMGAKVLHPYCIKPCQEKNIPIHIKNTYGDNINNTIINNDVNNEYTIMFEKNVSVFEVTSLDMWNDYGFVSHIFESFKNNGLDINIITTSQFSVMVTTNEINSFKLIKCKNELKEFYEVKVHNNCDIISIVGKDILQFDKINKLFENIKKYDSLLISHFSSNNMCVSYVLPNKDSVSFYKELYYKLFHKIEDNNIQSKWWYMNKNRITSFMTDKNDAYLYNLDVVRNKCANINLLHSIDKKFYAIKANNNINILNEIYKNNFGFECVSKDEVIYIKKLFPDALVLFTPNYCSIEEYKFVIENYLCFLTIDNSEILMKFNEYFKNTSIILRLDMNMGDGHHQKVITEGSKSKFGIPLSELDKTMTFCIENDIDVIGYHSHRGSNINNISNWVNVLKKLKEYAIKYNVNILNLGGGFGTKLIESDFIKLDEELYELKNQLELWIEPGRYLVSESGILLSKVNLVRNKNGNHFIGLNTGMNSLMRPVLYDAYHGIHNLTNIDNTKNTKYDIVGPICESGDIFGNDRLLPETEINDIILIEDAGAYGYTMSNNYNMRKPAQEYCISTISFNLEESIKLN